MIGNRLAQATEGAVELLRGAARLEDVAHIILERLAQAAGCEWAAHWAVDPLSQRLRVIASWSALGSKGLRLQQDARVRTLSLNQGNPGHVWRSGKPIWTTSLVLEMCLPRSLDAVEAGLSGGVWFAVKTDTAVYGVIELLARLLEQKTSEILGTVERTGIRLGYALEALRRERPPQIH